MDTYIYDQKEPNRILRKIFQASSSSQALEKYFLGSYDSYEVLLGLGRYYGEYCQGLFRNLKIVDCKSEKICKKCPYRVYLEKLRERKPFRF